MMGGRKTPKNIFHRVGFKGKKPREESFGLSLKASRKKASDEFDGLETNRGTAHHSPFGRGHSGKSVTKNIN